MWKQRKILLVLGAVMMLTATAAEAAPTVERLVMPGEVIQGHAKYENVCSRCHKPFSKTAQRSLCLNCHKKVATDISKRLGFHGLSKDVKGTECKHCHTDHKGRKANIVLLDKEVFDHTVTDFPLKGGHTKIKCAECHTPKAKYREAPSKCIDCHKDDDPHYGRLGTACGDCHGERMWSATNEGRFDHDKTEFPLQGKHTKVACNRCHPSERYKKTPKACFACHKLNDIHGGRYGKKCETCHAPKDWKRSVFDHDKTEFPLRGTHQKIKCDTCHKEPLYDKKKLAKTCYGCHKNDDEHRGRYGKKCETCHTPKDWKRSVFDHDKTEFPLRGKHQKVKCDTCHRGPIYDKKLGKSCHTCHNQDDVHKGQEGKRCERCHNDLGWRKKVFFDHDLTQFPLIGLHATVPCEACHLTPTYKNTPLACMGCHTSDDEHKGRLGPKCGVCHNPNGWRLWRFDHNSQTEYKLDGAHEGLYCYSCHSKSVKEIDMSTSCSNCHQGDDIHRGMFGLLCERCHVTKSFKEITVAR